MVDTVLFLKSTALIKPPCPTAALVKSSETAKQVGALLNAISLSIVHVFVLYATNLLGWAVV